MDGNLLPYLLMSIVLGMIVLSIAKIFFKIKFKLWSLLSCYLGIMLVIIGFISLIPNSWRVIGAFLCFIGGLLFIVGSAGIVKEIKNIKNKKH